MILTVERMLFVDLPLFHLTSSFQIRGGAFTLLLIQVNTLFRYLLVNSKCFISYLLVKCHPYFELNSPKNSNRDYLEANDPCREMMENCFDSIVL